MTGRVGVAAQPKPDRGHAVTATRAETLMPLPAAGRWPFDLTIDKGFGRAVVGLVGGLDRAGSLMLEDIVIWLCRDGYARIELDLDGLRALHSSALRSLTRCIRQAAITGGTLTITGNTALSRRLIRLVHQ